MFQTNIRHQKVALNAPKIIQTHVHVHRCVYVYLLYIYTLQRKKNPYQTAPSKKPTVCNVFFSQLWAPDLVAKSATVCTKVTRASGGKKNTSRHDLLPEIFAP